MNEKQKNISYSWYLVSTVMVFNLNLSTKLDLSKITLHYQPQIDVESGRILGFEVLSRLEENGKELKPTYFMDHISRQGQHPIFTQIVLLKFINDYHKFFINMDSTVRFSINIEPTALVNQRVLCALKKIIDHRLNHKITLEITEEKLPVELEFELKYVTFILKNLGYEISIDDFGTGYSDINRIILVQPNEVKLDKDLIKDIDKSQTQFIIDKICKLSKLKNFRVIAEGIESVELQNKTIELGLTLHQGFLYSKPVPAYEAIEFLYHHPLKQCV